MTEVLHSPSHFSSSPSSLSCAPTTNDVALQTQTQSQTQTDSLININNNPNSSSSSSSSSSPVAEEDDQVRDRERKGSDNEGDQLSLLALLITVFRKSMVACRTDSGEKVCSMEIGWPTNVRHVAHVTFDRFNGFLGLPVEFEPEVPRRAPSASANVFGVSTESMQCSYDSRGNSVPTILLLMQRRLYAQGGLQTEGIFRISTENSQEEYVRDQLNSGVVPDGVDVHCLAGLIKAWFRELPSGVLDPLEPEQVMQCQSEEDYTHLVRLLPPTEAALLDWAINLMADIVQEELQNKMNARNVAMVFAPNMTQMADPLTALMYAVQVMNFLKTLIMKTLKDREDSATIPFVCHLEPSDENGHHSPSVPYLEEGPSQDKEDREHIFFDDEPVLESPPHPNDEDDSRAQSDAQDFQTYRGKAIPDRNESMDDDFYSSVIATQTNSSARKPETGFANVPKPVILATFLYDKTGQSSNSNFGRELRKIIEQPVVQVAEPAEKAKEISIVSRINPRTERVEAWR
ncbi:CRIB domain [Macleaya cordata]|uniref:CRIB domain n=1 Tax=Macleaya cordata TaxID=56857 RepID=A0A200QHW7_MACCD|nr:CRIB domain [Macleaya cordata]